MFSFCACRLPNLHCNNVFHQWQFPAPDAVSTGCVPLKSQRPPIIMHTFRFCTIVIYIFYSKCLYKCYTEFCSLNSLPLTYSAKSIFIPSSSKSTYIYLILAIVPIRFSLCKRNH